MEKARNVDIRQFYREDLGVHSEELLDKLEAVSQAVTLQKGEILNKKGERQTMLPFLIEGMMRCVTLDREGKEKTVGFTMSRGDVVLSNMDLRFMSTNASWNGRHFPYLPLFPYHVSES
jgi:CRP-like cAMP-binding protein